MNPTYVRLWHNHEGTIAYLETTASLHCVQRTVEDYLKSKHDGDELDPSEIVDQLHELGENARFLEMHEIQFDYN